MNRKLVVLIALLVVLALALVYAFWTSPVQEQAVTSPSKHRSTASTPKKVAQDGLTVKLELLENDEEAFHGVKRDLFGPLFPPPRIEKRPVAPPPVVAPPPPPVIKPPTPVEIVRRELSKFTFMGYLRKQDKWTIFLSSNGEIFLVQEGDRFGKNNQFHAVEITPEQLVIMQASQGRIVIPLVEQQSLVPSSFPSAAPGRGGEPEPTTVPTSPATSSAPTISPRSLRPSPFRGGGMTVPTPEPPPVLAPPEAATNDEVPNDR